MKRHDGLILWGAFTVVALSFGVWMWSRGSSPGLVAEISRNGLVTESVDLMTLEKPVTLLIESADGEGYNEIRLEPRRAAVIDANCPDELCVRSGWLTRSGQSAVCLPHRLALYLKGDSGLDGISH